MPPIFKNNHFFSVKELEMFIELGHSSTEFNKIMEEHGITTKNAKKQ